MDFYICLKDSDGNVLLETCYNTMISMDDAFSEAVERCISNRESGPYSCVHEITKGRKDAAWGRIRYAVLHMTDGGEVLA